LGGVKAIFDLKCARSPAFPVPNLAATRQRPNQAQFIVLVLPAAVVGQAFLPVNELAMVFIAPVFL